MGAQRKGGQCGDLRSLIWGGLRDGTQCDLSPAICSSINHSRIYTPRLALCSVWGQGRGYFRVWGRGGVGLPLPETRVGHKHALWAATYRCTAGGVWVIQGNSLSIRDCSQGQGLTTNTHTVFHLCTYAVDFAVDKMTPACLAEEERLEKRKMKELFINLQTECTGAPLQ